MYGIGVQVSSKNMNITLQALARWEAGAPNRRAQCIRFVEKEHVSCEPPTTATQFESSVRDAYE